MRLPLILLAVSAISACAADETLRAYGASDKTWALQSIDGQAFAASATVQFPQAGRIAGKAPCNAFTGPMTAPYPWFEIKALAVTRVACPELDLETQFLSALQAMTLSEVSGNTMILSTPEGREMLFTSEGG